MSFISRIRWQGLYSGPEPALSIPGPYRDTVSYARLNQYISNFSRRLRGLGVAPGSVYGLHIADTLLHIVAMLALEQLGAASVSVKDVEGVDAWPIAGILCDESVATSRLQVEMVDLNWLQGQGGFEHDPRREGRGPDDLCRIVLTSGSTGLPRGVAYTNRMVEERIARFSHAFGGSFPSHRRMLCCMGLSSSLGYLFLVYTLARGGMFCAPDPSIDRTARKVALYNIQNLIASPLTLAQFWAGTQTNGMSFRPLELIITAGSLMSKSLADRLRVSVCNRIISLYGSAEAGVVATALAEGLDLDNGEVGFVVPGVQVDTVAAPGEAGGGGTIRIRSEANARAYFGPEGQRSGTFDGDAFYPGDRGHVGANRMLSIFGRENNVVNLGGVKTTLEQIETRYASAPGIVDVALTLTQDAVGIQRTVAFVVPTATWSETAFQEFCHRNVAREFWPIKVIASQELPRTETGKIDRQRLAEFL